MQCEVCKKQVSQTFNVMDGHNCLMVCNDCLVIMEKNINHKRRNSEWSLAEILQIANKQGSIQTLLRQKQRELDKNPHDIELDIIVRALETQLDVINETIATSIIGG